MVVPEQDRHDQSPDPTISEGERRETKKPTGAEKANDTTANPVDSNVRGALERMRKMMKNGNGDKPFSTRAYETITQQVECRELEPRDFQAIGELYQASEMPSAIFTYLANGHYEDAEREASGGGMIDRWMPTQLEMAALKRHNPNYIASGEEMSSFITQSYKPESKEQKGRVADFRAWGLFDADKKLQSIAAAFLPPTDAEENAIHAEQVQKLFTGQYSEEDDGIEFYRAGKNVFAYSEAHQKRAPTTAEFYLITQQTNGAATLVFDRMLQDIEAEGIPITDWFLLRFGTLKVVEPSVDERLVRSGENDASKKFFTRRGFKDIGNCSFANQVAARSTEEGVVVVEPEWKVMWGVHEDVVTGSDDEVKEIHRKATVHQEKDA